MIVSRGDLMRIQGQILTVCTAILLGVLIPFGLAAAEEQPDVLVFYRDECNDCRRMDEVLDELLSIYPEIYVAHVEENEPGAADLMWALSAKYGIFPSKFPVIFVGDQVIVGVGRDKELRLRSAVRSCIFDDCPSPLSRLERDPFPLTTVAIMVVVVLTAAILFLF
jgi:glutaredoxin